MEGGVLRRAEGGPSWGGWLGRAVLGGVLWGGGGEVRGPGDLNVGQMWKLAQNIKTSILIDLAKNLGLAKLVFGQRLFGQTWIWP